MDDPRILSPIPTPAAQRWREVRLIYLPRAVFVLGVLVAGLLWTQWVAPATLVAEAVLEEIDIRSTQTGVLGELTVTLHQSVHAGDVVGEIVPVRSKLPGSEVPKSVPLTAPFDGVVSLLARGPSDTVLAGQLIMRLSAARPNRLVGFIRQPLPFEPKPGMVAEIRTRTSPRQTAVTTIREVGSSMEPIMPTLIAAMRLPSNPPPEPALRIYLAMPAVMKLRPGEHVDVIIR